MNDEFWLDGFNFFHHWEKTRDLFRQGLDMDVAKALERALRVLARELGRRQSRVLVFLDGGLNRRETRQACLRVRYCGPGNKADDRMAEDLYDLGDQARRVTAVTNDRELKARLCAGGASCLTVGEFLDLLAGKKKSVQGKKMRQSDNDDILREKCRTLSPAEVAAWLELFGGDRQA